MEAATGTFAKAGLLVAIASEFGFPVEAVPVEGGVEVTTLRSAWGAIRAELAVEVGLPDAMPGAQELHDAIVAQKLDS